LGVDRPIGSDAQIAALGATTKTQDSVRGTCILVVVRFVPLFEMIENLRLAVVASVAIIGRATCYHLFVEMGKKRKREKAPTVDSIMSAAQIELDKASGMPQVSVHATPINDSADFVSRSDITDSERMPTHSQTMHYTSKLIPDLVT
jgi:hypothetical protein